MVTPVTSANDEAMRTPASVASEKRCNGRNSVSRSMLKKIEAAFRNKQVRIQFWADGDARVYRIQMVSSTGDERLDAIIRDHVLQSLMLSEPPGETSMIANNAGHLSADNGGQTIQYVE
jgi:hypothetical protein